MKKLYTLLVLLLPFALIAKEPAWVKKLPMADNNTYEYRTEEATDLSANAAEQKAFAKILNGTIMRLGLPADAEDVTQALLQGNPLEDVVKMYNIPVNKVCSYVDKIEGGFRCYVLCQVGIKRSIEPIWSSFNKCGSAAGKDVVETDYPIEWNIYESEEYFASFQREQFEKGTKQTEAIASLLAIAGKDLRNKLGIEEGNTDFMILTDSRTKFFPDIRSDASEACVVLFISRNQLIKYYDNAAKNLIGTLYSTIAEAEEYVKARDDGEADYRLIVAQQQLNEATHNTNRLQAFGQDVTERQEELAALQTNILDLQKKVGGGANRGKKEKINNYIGLAISAQNDARISEALKYYFWANILLNSLPAAEIYRQQYTDIDDNVQQVATWLPKQITTLLKDLTFSYAGQSEENPEMGIINVMYKKSPVKSLDYRYYTNMGWSELFRAKDGTGVIRFYNNEKNEQKLTLKIEYAFTQETTIDQEITALLEQNTIIYPYDKDATKTLDIRKITAAQEGGMTMPIKLANIIHNANTDVKEGKYAGVSTIATLSEKEQQPYRIIIDNICEALRTRKTHTVKSYFTTQANNLFTQLTNSGRIAILDKNHISFYRLGNNVVARAVKMSFAYDSNHKTFVEDVVFEFNQDKKIENLRYMLERGTIETIAQQEDWSDAAKLALTDFLENYKSSYALRDTNYLHHVFDDNAIIIVGRVIKPATDHTNINFSNQENVEYTRHTKKSYLAALSKTFKNNSFVNVAFSDLYIKHATKFASKNMYGLRLKQTFSSTHYGDQGYLFLLMDLTNYEKPIIYVRTWQPKPDMDKLSGDGLFSDADFK